MVPIILRTKPEDSSPSFSRGFQGRNPLLGVTLAVTLLLAGVTLALPGQSQGSAEQDLVVVKAGETFKFTIILEHTPTSSDGRIIYESTGASGPFIPRYSCGSTVPGIRTYVCEFKTSDKQRGTVTHKIVNIRVEYPDRFVKLETKKIVTFRVVGAPPPITMTEGAELIVNLSQTQLLRREGARLQRRVSDLKAAVLELEKAKEGLGPLTRLLRSNVEQAVDELKVTEREFEKLSTAKELETSRVFFEDLRISYERALARLSGHATIASRSCPAFNRASLASQVAGPDYALLAEATLRPFEGNVIAYELVADSGSLTFNLDVGSTPIGAKISYFRRGEKPREHQALTNSTIHALPFAIWFIKFEKEGYNVEEREHDPFREPNSTVHVDLRKK